MREDRVSSSSESALASVAFLLLVPLVFAGGMFAIYATKHSPKIFDVPMSEAHIVTRAFDSDDNMEAMIKGRLDIRNRCVVITRRGQPTRTVIWRSGYQVSEDKRGKRFVHHPDIPKRYKIGKKLRASGGYISAPDKEWLESTVTESAIPSNCPNQYVLIDKLL